MVFIAILVVALSFFAFSVLLVALESGAETPDSTTSQNDPTFLDDDGKF